MSWTSADVGKKCKTSSGKRGTVKWVGEGDFAPGTWVGVELSTADGKHDGEVKGKRYFKCKPKHGVMLKPEQVKKAVAVRKGAAPTKSSTAKGPTKTRAASKTGASMKRGSVTGKKPSSRATGRTPTSATGRATKKPSMAGVVKKTQRAEKARTRTTRPGSSRPGSGARPTKKAGLKKSSGASALAAKRKALAAARGGKKTPAKKGATPRSGKKAPTKAASKPAEPDANELLRQKIMAKLRGEPLPDAGNAGEGDDGAPDLPADSDSSGTGNNLKDKIAARLAAIRSDGTSPPLSPVSSVGGSTTASPGKGIQRSPDHIPAYKRCTTKEEVAVLIQALCRGYLIRVEQFNLLDASVKLLRVEDNQWLVDGQGVAEVTDEVVPYVQVIGWKLDKRAWESTKSLLYETPIRPGDTLTREDDGLGPPIYILNDEYDDIVRGLEFALPQDEEAFEEMYAFARRDQAALIIQSAFRGAKVRWNLAKTKRRGQAAGGKKARNPALPTPTATPEHHPPIGALIKVKRPMKKSKIGRLISYATFTGKFTIQYADKTREIDLDKTKYSIVSDESAQAP